MFGIRGTQISATGRPRRTQKTEFFFLVISTPIFTAKGPVKFDSWRG